MKRLPIYLLFVILCSSFIQETTGYVPVTNLADLEKKLNEVSKTTNTIVSDFVQEKHLAYLEDTIVSKGKFWFKKENLLRWEYNTPYKYIIVINNGKFIIQDETKTSEYDIESNKAFQKVNDMIISSVRGTLLADDQFTIKAFEDSKSYFIKLTPKDEAMKEILSKIELYFDKTTLQIYKVKIIENEDDFTVISFNKRTINEQIQASIFTVK